MKQILLILCLMVVSVCIHAQGTYSLNLSSDRNFYCSPGQISRVSGQVQSFTATVFVGITYHFYYYASGFYQEIGYYSVSFSGGIPFSSYGNILPFYFDGSQIVNPQWIPSSPSTLWISADVPYAAFPNNNTGQQLVVDIEGIDQFGSTTTHSTKLNYAVPLLYSNPVVLSSASITSDIRILCGSAAAKLSGAPNMGIYGFGYDWYKDGSVFSLSDPTGMISVTAPGSYHAIVSDVCQSAISNSIVISSGNPPGKPLISSSNGSLLCNGAATTLSTTPTASGTIYWNTGATGNSISVNTSGDYYCWEVNGCGQGPNSDLIHISTGSSPSAPILSSSAGTFLCNGAATTITASGINGTVTWSTGQTGSSIIVSAAGSYYAYQTNGCGNSGNSNTLIISTGSTPAAPTIVSSNGALLCNGASTTLTASGVSATLTWSTGQTGSSITVSNAGAYYAYQTNGCGSSGNSNTLTINTLSIPAAPTIVSSNGSLLCNGSSSILTASGVTGSVGWSTGQTGNSISVSSAGTYYAFQSNSCGTSGHSNMISISTAGTPAAPAVASSNGSFLCNGASTVLSASPSGGGIIHWSTGATGNTVTLTAPGSYYAWEQNGCGNSPNSNTVVITTGSSPAAPTVSPGFNQLLCNGATTTLSSTGSNISWSTGATGNSLSVSSAGTYYAYDRNACGNSSLSNQVVIATGNCPIPAPGSAYTICPGTNKTLDAGAGFDSYLWTNGATTQTVSVGAGTYSVTVTKNGCTAVSAAVTVNYFPVTAPVITASGPTTFCAGSSVTISSSPGTAYLWSTGSTGSSINVSTTGNFNVTVTDNNGCQSGSRTISTTLRALPGASITGSSTVCQNGSSPAITFSGSAGTAPYLFSYRVNGGAAQSIATTSGSNISLPVPTSVAGSFTYALIGVQESSSTACAASASGSATVLVNPLPVAEISGTTTVCQNGIAPQISFTGSAGTAPYNFVYRINSGPALTVSSSVGNSVSVSVPTGSSGIYTYTLVSVSDASNTSCSNTASGTATITVNPLPSASIAGNALVCQNGASPLISFTGAYGTAPYTFTYTINGGSSQTVSTTTGNSVSISAPTATAGIFTYNLVSIRDAGATACTNTASGSVVVTVNPLPSASVSGTTTVCQNSTPPLVSFTGSAGTAPYTFIYKINNGPNQSVSTSSGNRISLTVPTATPGSYTYTLVAVTDASNTNCSQAANGSATISINALPVGNISGDTAVCQNATSPLISFIGSNGTAPYTFTYRINGGANQTISTTTGSSITLAAPTSTAGSFTYSLISIQDGSATACTNSATGAITITVYPQPDVAVISTGETHLCNGSSGVIKILNYVNANSYRWYDNQTFLRTSGKDTIHNDQAGTFTVRAISGQGCQAASISNEIKITTGSVPAPVILGAAKVCEGGKTELLVSSRDKPYDIWRWTDPPDTKNQRQIYGWDSHFFAEAGQYQVWVMRQGCFDSSVVTVTADDTEFPAGELKMSAKSVVYGGVVFLTAAVSPASSFQWDFGDGTKAVTRDSVVQQYYYKAADSVLVQVDAVSPRNCLTHFSGWLRVLPEPVAPKRKAFEGGNLKDWNVFPIPFHDHLEVSVILKRKQEVRVDLFSADGKRVMSWIKAGVQGENLFRLEGVDPLPNGVMYFITAIYDNEKHFDKVYKN